MKIISDFAVVGGGTAGLIAALLIKDKYPLSKVCIIKSDEIGIIGVGEGSTEHWMWLMKTVGIDFHELIYKTDASIKIGILFKNWTDTNSMYCHSVGFAEKNKHDRLDSLLMLSLKNKNSDFPTALDFKHYFNKKVIINNLSDSPSNQFHFNTFKLNTFLIEFCSLRGIEIFNDKIINVNLNENGFVENLLSEKNYNFHSNFFIDCTGFKRVISSAVGTKWVSKKNNLPMNHAIAFPTEHDDDNFEPYTLSQAMDYGWVWKIPTQQRYGNGYVFCDEYADSSQVLDEFNKKFNKNVTEPAKDIKFEAGHVDKFWNKNVLNVGLSSSFAEPLEAQSIGFTIIQCFNFIHNYDSWKYNKEKISNQYNERMIKSFENVVDFVQLHYMGEKTSSNFWKDREFVITDFLKENIPLMKNGIFDMFNECNTKTNMFNPPNFLQVLQGLDLIDYDKILFLLKGNDPSFNVGLENQINDMISSSIHNKKIMLNHNEYLNILCKVYINNI